jgi:hypothetical protein
MAECGLLLTLGLKTTSHVERLVKDAAMKLTIKIPLKTSSWIDRL